MDYIVTGTLGSGKTLYSVTMAIALAEKADMALYSNIEIRHPRWRRIRSVKHFALLRRVVVLLDEAHRNLDARMWSQNKEIADAILYNRKRMKHCLYTTPAYGNLEKRLRDVCPILIACDRLPGSPAIRVGWYDAQRVSAMGNMRRIRFQTLDDPSPAYGIYNTQEEAPVLPLSDDLTDAAIARAARSARPSDAAAGRGARYTPPSLLTNMELPNSTKGGKPMRR